MNPFIQKHFDDINERLDDLENALRNAHERTAHADKQRTEVLESQLKQRKQLVTLQHKADAYDQLHTEHERLTTTQSALHERLRKLLALTKALTAEMRP